MSTLDPDMGELVHQATEKIGIDRHRLRHRRPRPVRKILVVDDESKMRVLFWDETLVAAASAWLAV